MRLSVITLSYLAFATNADAFRVKSKPSSSGASVGSASSLESRRRMLQKTEDRLLREDRSLQGRSGNGRDNGSSSGGKGGGRADNGSRGKSGGRHGSGGRGVGSLARGGGRGGNREHSAHLDRNDAGISLDGTEYEYGSDVEISFELTNDKVADDVLLRMDVDKLGEYTLGVFMRMADPQDGALEPIASVPANIVLVNDDDAPPRKLLRKLQDGEEPPAEDDPEREPEMPTDNPEPPTLNYKGSATFATDAKTLDINEYGTGFDVFLLDESGGAVVGPATFYMKKTDAMMESEADAKKKKPSKSGHGLSKYNHAAKTKGKGYGANANGGRANGGRGKVVQGGRPNAKGMGLGSGSNGGMIIGTGVKSLADYRLETDMEYYVEDDTVVVTYNLDPEEGRRFLQRNGGRGNGNGNGKDKGNNGGGISISDPATTTAATTTAAVTTGAPDTTTTTTSTTIVTTTEAPPPDMESRGGLEGQPSVDPDDVTLFTVGIYMRMAHPQGGALPPLYSVPFCADPENCGKSVEELQSGEVSFPAGEVDIHKNGHGFDVWILNGRGEGIAGPKTFFVEEA